MHLKFEEIKAIVFSGGASKGYAHIGALEHIESMFRIHGINMVDQINGYGGSSIGALIALACCVCVDSVSEAIEFLSSIDPKSAMTLDYNFATSKAIVKNSGFIEMVNSLLAMRFGRAIVDKGLVTLDFLYRKTQKHLKIVVSNMTTENWEVWDWQSRGDMQVSAAIMASCALPGVFEPIVLDRSIYMDGGNFMNFPISVFDHNSVLGINFVTKRTINADFLSKASAVEYISQIQFSIIKFFEKQLMSQIYGDHNIRHKVILVDLSFLKFSPVSLLAPDPMCIDVLKKAGRVSAWMHFVCHTFTGHCSFIFMWTIIAAVLWHMHNTLTNIILHNYLTK